MDDAYPRSSPFPHDLVRRVAVSTGLDEATAARVVADVLAYFGQTVEEYVVRRHQELKDRNRKNDAIWPQLAAELKARRFKAEELSERQLRRIVYPDRRTTDDVRDRRLHRQAGRDPGAA